MSISFSGLASGLDTSSWVESLVALKQAKVDTLEEEKETVLLSQETLNNIKSFFSSFRTVIEKVTDAQFGIPTMDIFAQNLANSSNTSVLTASATTEAEESTYEVLVDKLASNTEASSNYTYMTTIIQTTTATLDTKLVNIGVNTGKIGVNVNGIEHGILIEESDTIQSFIEKMKEIGVEASFNTTTGIFSINIDANAINDIDATGIVDAFHLEGVNEGYVSSDLSISKVDTIYSAATEGTLLSELGVQSGEIVVAANDTTYTININENSTIGSLISDLTNNGILAELDSTGVFTITDAEIVDEGNTNILNALGLEVDIYGKIQTTGNLTHVSVATQITSATLDTQIKDLGSGLEITDGDTIIVTDKNNTTTTITIDESDTLGDLLEAFEQAGISATLKPDNTLELSGGVIEGGSFDISDSLGLNTEEYKGSVTGKPLTETVTEIRVADTGTKLVEDLGVKTGYLEITDTNGNIHYEKIYKGQTIGNFIADLSSYGIRAALGSDGVLEIAGGSFTTLSDEQVNELISRGVILESDSEYMQGTDLLTKLYGSPVISTDQITVVSAYAKTQALTFSSVNTVKASETTTLGNLGLETDGTAVFSINNEDKTINVTGTMTIGDLLSSLQSSGINASWDSLNAKISIEDASLTGGTSNLSEVLSLTTTVNSKYVTSEGLTKLETVISSATEDTLLSQFGISDSMSISERTAEIYDNNGNLINSVILTENLTLGEFINYINSTTAQASLKNGVFEIENGYIENSVLEEAMGLETSSKSSYVLGSVMTVTTAATVIDNTTLGEIVSILGTQSAVSGGYTLRFDGEDLNVSSSTTVGDLMSQIQNFGGTARFDSSGRLVISGGTLSGTVASALGITVRTGTTGVSATGDILYTEGSVNADRGTTFAELGVTKNLTYILHDTDGSTIRKYTVKTTDTIGEFLDTLENNDISGTIENGVISLDSLIGKYISGEIADFLGLSTQLTTKVVETTQSSTAAITHTDTIVADLTTKLGNINAITQSDDNILIYNSHQECIGTISTLTTESTIGDMFNALSIYDISGTIQDGIISLTSNSNNYAAGKIMENLGIIVTEGLATTVTVGQTVTSTMQITCTTLATATAGSTLGELGISDASKGFLAPVSQLSESEAKAQGYTIIKTAAQLQSIKDDLNGKYILMNDIDLTGFNWTSIGDATNKFAGELNGNGYVIKNLVINKTSSDYQGLFGYIDRTALIKNLGMENVNVKAKNYAGAIVGYNFYGTIENSYSKGTVNARTNYAGGLAGYNLGSIVESSSSASVKAASYSGGITGANYGTISNAYVNGSINGTNTIGGIAGANFNLIEESFSAGIIKGTGSVGGIAGENWSAISDSMSISSVSGSSNTGGVVGINNDSVTSSYAVGKVSGTSKTGAFAGTNSGTITDSGFNETVTTVTAAVGSGGSTGVNSMSLDDISSIYNNGTVGMIDNQILVRNGSNSINSVIVNSEMTVYELFEALETYGISGTINDGVITFNSSNGGYVVGEVVSALGINLVSSNTVAVTSTSTMQISCTTITTATKSTTLDYLGVSSDSIADLSHLKPGSDGFIKAVDRLTESEAKAQGYTIIRTAGELQNISNNPDGKYILMNDIEMSGFDWTPISAFKGELNGNGYSINNLTIDKNQNNLALFSTAEAGALIKNLGIENANISQSYTNGQYHAVLIASVTGSATISNVYATGNVNGSQYTGGLVVVATSLTIENTYASVNVNTTSTYYQTGGLIAQGSYITINNSFTSGNVVSQGDYNGGLIGSVNNSLISNSYASGDVTGDSYTGGLIGQVYTNVTISNSYASGDVTGSSYTGGLIGSANSTVTISNSCAFGNVYGLNDYVGGFAGNIQSNVQIAHSYASGNVKGNKGSVGGFAGYVYNSVTISDTYASGNVSGLNGTGGFAGSVSTSTTITNSYSTGDITGGQYTGGFVGNANGSVKISNSYAAGDVSGANYTGGFAGYVLGSTITNSYTSGYAESYGSIAGAHTGYIAGNSKISGSYYDNSNTGIKSSVGSIYVTKTTTVSTSISGIVTYEINNKINSIQTDNLAVKNGVETVGIINLSKDMTVEELLAELEKYNIHGTIENGVISLSSDDGNYIIGNLANKMGLYAVLEGDVATTSGISSTSTIAITKTELVTATENAKLSELGYNETTSFYTASTTPSGFIQPVGQISEARANELGYTVIKTADQLQNMSSGKYILMNDIDLSGYNWQPINGFYGELNGNGYVIENLTINTTSDYQGLFGTLSSSTTITALGMENVNIKGGRHTGALVGLSNEPLYISNVYVKGSIKGGNYTGGIVGNPDRLRMTNSYAIADVQGVSDVGGLVGYAAVPEDGYTYITNSFSSGKISGSSEVGGLVGQISGDGSIVMSYSSADVESSRSYAGGLVGELGDYSIYNSYATGNVSGASYVGGITGYSGPNSYIRWVYSTGDVYGSSNYVGGIAGYARGNWDTYESSYDGSTQTSWMEATIGNCYATGNVTGQDYVGGISGAAYIGDIDNVSYSGQLTGNNYVGGLVGENNSYSSLSGGLFTGRVYGNRYVGGVVGDNSESLYSVISAGIVTGEEKQTTGGLVGRTYGGFTSSYALSIVNNGGAIAGDFDAGTTTVTYDPDAVNTTTMKVTGGGTLKTSKTTTEAVAENINNGTIFTPDDSIIIRNGAYTSGIIRVNSDMTLADLFEELESYGIRAEMQDGKIVLTSPENTYILGDAAQKLGIGVIATGGDNTNTTGMTTSSTLKITYQEYTTASLDTTLSDLGAKEQAGFIQEVVKLTEDEALTAGYSIIKTADDLKNIKNNLDGRYILMNDIDLDGVSWQVINDFTGELNGNGYVIKNLTINNASSDNQGLFGTIDGALIKNVGLVNASVRGKTNVGGLVGLNDGTISNSYVTGDISGLDYVGGIAGSNSGMLKSVFSLGSVEASNMYAGGIAGSNFDTITTAFSAATVEGNSVVGGISGDNWGLISQGYFANSVSGNSITGAFVGDNSNGRIQSSRYDKDAAGSTGGVSQGSTSGLSALTTTQINSQINSGTAILPANYLIIKNGSDYVDSFIINPETSIEDLFEKLSDYGIEGKLENSIVSLTSDNGNYIAGDIATILGVDVITTNTVGVAATSTIQVTAGGAVSYATSSTTLEELGYTIQNSASQAVTAGQSGFIAEIDQLTESEALAQGYTIIKTATELQAMKGNGKYILMNDIDLDGISWSAINGFNGELNGNGYSIKNLTINSTSSKYNYYQGLFGYTNNGAVIKNLGLEDVDIKGYTNVGAVVGSIASTTTISNVFVTGNIESVTNNVGGLVGRGYSLTINSCYVSGNVGNGSNYAGGLVGIATYTTILQSYSDAYVNGYNYTGGLIGQAENHTKISSSYVQGAVSGFDYTGGLIGYVANRTTILSSFTTDSVNGRNYVGGIVGYNQYTIRVADTYSLGDISGENYVGGLIGFLYYGNYTTITDSFTNSNAVLGYTTYNISGTSVSNVHYNPSNVIYTASNTTLGSAATTEEIWDYVRNADVHPSFDIVMSTGGNSYKFIDITPDMTISQLFQKLSEYGFTGSINNGVITLESQDNLTISGDIIDILDLSYDNTLTAAGKSATSTSAITVQNTVGTSATLASLGISASAGSAMQITTEAKTAGFMQNITKLSETEAKNQGYKIIKTAAQLQNIKNDLDGKYILMNDINLSGVNWTAIAGFYGELNGNGYSIKNLKINSTTSDQGLFASAKKGTNIKNLGLENVDIDGGNYVGALIGSVNKAATISNVFATGNVNGTYYVGGLIGDATAATLNISYTNASVNVSSTGDYTGGLIGRNQRAGTIKDCFTLGNVRGNRYTGGLIGYAQTVRITNTSASGDVQGSSDTGGLLGLYQYGTLTSSYTTGDVSGMNSNSEDIGGLIGQVGGDALISDVYATGDVSGFQYVGGLIGWQSVATIRNSYTSGDITGYSTVGGIFGYHRGSSDSKVTASLATGSINNKQSIKYYDNSATITLSNTAELIDKINTGSINVLNNNLLVMNDNDVIGCINITSGMTISQLAGELAKYGIEATLKDGYLSFNSKSGAYLAGTALTQLGSSVNISDGKFVNSDSKRLESSSASNAASNNKLKDFSIVNDTFITVVQNGTEQIITLSAENTINDIVNALKQYGMTASFSGAKLTITGNNNAYVKEMSAELENLFKIEAGNGYTYETESAPDYTSRQIVISGLNADSRFANLGMTGDNYITVVSNNTQQIITIKGSNTVNDMISFLKDAGVNITYNNGILNIDSSKIAYIKDISSGLKNILGLQTGNGKTYTASTEFINGISDKIEYTGMFTLSEKTTMENIGLTGRTTIEISGNGTAKTFEFSVKNNIADIINTLGENGINAYINDGKLTIESIGNNYITNISPELAAALNINYGAGNTYKKGAEFENTISKAYIDTQITTTITLTSSFGMLGLNNNNYITVVSNNTQQIITITGSTTIDELLTKLREKGFTTSLSNGIIKISGNENTYIKGMSEELEDILKIKTGSNYTYITGECFLNTDSKTQNKQDITTINTRTSLGSIGLTNDGYFTIITNGLERIVTVKSEDTVANLISDLKEYGIYASLQGGKVILEGTGTSYVKDISQNVKDVLKIQAGDNITYKDGSFIINSDSELQGDINTMTVTTINTESTFSDIRVKGDNYITVVSNGSEQTITIFSDYTIRDMISELSRYGISASVQNGVLTINANRDAYIKDISRELKNALKLKTGENNSWVTDGDKTWVNSDSDYKEYEIANLKVTGDTVISAIDGYNNGNGKLLVHTSNGKFATITIDATQTVDEFFNQLSEYGLSGNIDSSGKVTIEGVGNTYLQAVSGGTNILTAMNLGNVIENVQTVTVNTTSKAFNYNSEIAASGASVLENLSNNAGQTMGSGDGTIILSTTSETGTQRFTLTFSRTQTLNDVIKKFGEFGIYASVDSDGAFSVNTSSLKDFDISGNLGNLLMGAYDKEYEVGTTNTSDVLTETTSRPMDNSALLSDFGVTGGNILITQMGVDYTVNINTTEVRTVADFTNLLMEYGFYSGIDSKGRLAVSAVGKSHLASIAGGSNILEVFGLENWTLNDTTQTSDSLTTYETILGGTTINTKLKDLLSVDGTNLDITSGNIYVNKNGSQYLVSIDTEDTLYTFANKLNQYGVKVELTYDGKLNISSEGDGYLTTDGLEASAASNILDKLNITGNWNTSQNSVSGTLEYVEDVDKSITAQTKLSELQDSDGNSLGITEGIFYVYSNGVRYTETITADMTVGEFQDLMSKYRIVSSISQNGSIILSAYNNTYLEEAEGTDKSNIISNLFNNWEYSNTYMSNKLEVSKDITKPVDENTKLSDINEGSYQSGVITVVKDGKEIDIQLGENDTVGDLLDKLASLGFEGSVNSNGELVISSNDNSVIKDSNGSNIFDIAGVNNDNWSQDNSYKTGDISSVVITTFDAAATKDTLLSLLGVSTGEYYIYNNGVRYTAFVSSDETIGSLIDTLKSFGIETSFVQTDSGSKLTILGNGDSYVAKSNSVTNASNIVEKLFTDKVSAKYEYTGLLQTSEIKTAQINATKDTLLSEFNTAWGNGFLKAEGNLAINVNGNESIVNITADETFGSLINKLQSIGVDASISNGVFTIQSGFDDITINQGNTTSSILVTLGLTYNDDLGGYMSSSNILEETKTIVEETTLSAANYANLDTKLGLLNISDGSLSIYRNGQKAVIQINSEETFNDLRARLASAYADLELEFDNGFLHIYSKDKDVELEIGSTTDTTNMLAITGLSKNENGKITSARELYTVNAESVITDTGLFKRGDVTEGSFIIGNATFTITDKTTLADIISMINSSEDANATAYWDNIEGELVIKSRTTGAAYINIEAGTSNFTDIMGFTTSEWDTNGNVDITRMNISAQKAGSNAKFSINGTAYTSASNTITSDISRIEGVTINLKGLTEGTAVTLTVERDKETLANAISDVVDSYNELMKNVDEAIATEGELHSETTLKLIRNQLRSYMTSSDIGATVFKNLSAIGISVGEASANNISTSTESIINLSFDKDKFIQAYDADEDALKALLIGSENNTGIFTKVEKLLEQSLQSVSGYFASAENSYKREISRIDNKILNATKDIERYRERLENKFASMDLLIANMQQQYSSFLV